jgi:hypothetical protein
MLVSDQVIVSSKEAAFVEVGRAAVRTIRGPRTSEANDACACRTPQQWPSAG